MVVMPQNPEHLVVSTAERPDLAPVVASWLWAEFSRARGSSLEQTLEAVRISATAELMPRTFVLLVDGKPVGTASLAAQDLATRPDLQSETKTSACFMSSLLGSGRGMSDRK